MLCAPHRSEIMPAPELTGVRGRVAAKAKANVADGVDIGAEMNGDDSLPAVGKRKRVGSDEHQSSQKASQVSKRGGPAKKQAKKLANKRKAVVASEHDESDSFDEYDPDKVAQRQQSKKTPVAKNHALAKDPAPKAARGRGKAKSKAGARRKPKNDFVVDEEWSSDECSSPEDEEISSKPAPKKRGQPAKAKTPKGKANARAKKALVSSPDSSVAASASPDGEDDEESSSSDDEDGVGETERLSSRDESEMWSCHVFKKLSACNHDHCSNKTFLPEQHDIM